MLFLLLPNSYAFNGGIVDHRNTYVSRMIEQARKCQAAHGDEICQRLDLHLDII
jgi:hypothetical protein